jgi:hypothetical protein
MKLYSTKLYLYPNMVRQNMKPQPLKGLGLQLQRKVTLTALAKIRGAWVAKSLTKSDELLGGAHSGNA